MFSFFTDYSYTGLTFPSHSALKEYPLVNENFPLSLYWFVPVSSTVSNPEIRRMPSVADQSARQTVGTPLRFRYTATPSLVSLG